MVSDFTLSRQRENIAGLEVEWRRVLVNRARTSCSPAGAARSFHMEGSFCVVVRSARTGHRMSALRPSRLERLATAESSFQIMPPFQFITLIGLPTEKHDAAVSHRRK